jgi:hypothetical protein
MNSIGIVNDWGSGMLRECAAPDPSCREHRGIAAGTDNVERDGEMPGGAEQCAAETNGASHNCEDCDWHLCSEDAGNDGRQRRCEHRMCASVERTVNVGRSLSIELS